MVRSRNQRGWLSWVAGVRTAWRVVGDGEFFCTGCGGDRCYQLLSGTRRLTVLRVPVLPRGAAAPMVECASCHALFERSALDDPTTTRLSLLLREATGAIALTVLAAGGTGQVALDAAVDCVRAGGHPDCTEDQLMIWLDALDAEGGQRALLDELHAALAPLIPHLARQGRESLLLDAARIAAADGPYREAECAVLATIGEALSLPRAETERLLSQTS